MDAGNVAAILVSLIAALGAIASARSSAKASTINTNASSRVEMEKDAYNRARNLDTETIRRQEVEIKELRTKNDELDGEVNRLRRDNQELHEEVRALRGRITRLERGLDPNTQEELHERWTDSHPHSD